MVGLVYTDFIYLTIIVIIEWELNGSFTATSTIILMGMKWVYLMGMEWVYYLMMMFAPTSASCPLGMKWVYIILFNHFLLFN